MVQDGHWAVLSRFPPMSISQLVAQRNVVQSYAAEHLVSELASTGLSTSPQLPGVPQADFVRALWAQAWTLTGYTLVYVFMQTFAFPGTVSLSMLAGGLFGAVQGLLLVAGAGTLACKVLCVCHLSCLDPWHRHILLCLQWCLRWGHAPVLASAG